MQKQKFNTGLLPKRFVYAEMTQPEPRGLEEEAAVVTERLRGVGDVPGKVKAILTEIKGLQEKVSTLGEGPLKKLKTFFQVQGVNIDRIENPRLEQLQANNNHALLLLDQTLDGIIAPPAAGPTTAPAPTPAAAPTGAPPPAAAAAAAAAEAASAAATEAPAPAPAPAAPNTPENAPNMVNALTAESTPEEARATLEYVMSEDFWQESDWSAYWEVLNELRVLRDNASARIRTQYGRAVRSLLDRLDPTDTDHQAEMITIMRQWPAADATRLLVKERFFAGESGQLAEQIELAANDQALSGATLARPGAWNPNELNSLQFLSLTTHENCVQVECEGTIYNIRYDAPTDRFYYGEPGQLVGLVLKVNDGTFWNTELTREALIGQVSDPRLRFYLQSLGR